MSGASQSPYQCMFEGCSAASERIILSEHGPVCRVCGLHGDMISDKVGSGSHGLAVTTKTFISVTLQPVPREERIFPGGKIIARNPEVN